MQNEAEKMVMHPKEASELLQSQANDTNVIDIVLQFPKSSLEIRPLMMLVP